MRERHLSGRDILIDLTSLLDVVFIILLIVICNQQRLTELTQTEQNTAQAQYDEAEALAQLYRDQLELSDNLEQYVFAVSVYASYDPASITTRHIRILKEGEEIERIDLIGNDTAKALEDFKHSLLEYIGQSSGQPVILTLNENDEHILYRDEKAIKAIFEELGGEYPNVFIRPAPTISP